MATPKVPGDQKALAWVCYMLKVKVTKFQLPIPNDFLAVLKNSWGQICPPLVQNRVNLLADMFLYGSLVLTSIPLNDNALYSANIKSDKDVTKTLKNSR